MGKKDTEEKVPSTDLEDSEMLEKLAEKIIEQYKDTALKSNFQGHIPKIKYLLSGRLKKLGTCMKASKVWKRLADYDYVITIQKTYFEDGPYEGSEALLLHELKHIMYIEAVTDEEGTIKKSARWGIVHHDVEEFIDVVKAYGAWEPGLASMMSYSSQPQETSDDPLGAES